MFYIESLNYYVFTLLSAVLFYVLCNRKMKNYPPGPTGLPLVGYLPFLGKEPHKALVKLGKTYGDIIGLKMGTKYTVILNEYSIFKEAMAHPASHNRAPKLFDHIPEIGFITANGEEWLEQRRFCLFSTRELGLGRSSWETLVQEEVNDFIDYIRSHNGQPLDISHRLSTAIGNNIISLLIGRRLERGKEDKTIQLLIDYSDVSFSYMGPSNFASLVPGFRKLFEWFKIAGYDKAAKVISNFYFFLKDEVWKHRNVPEVKALHDFINMYTNKLEEKANENKRKHYFSEVNLEGNAKILFLAASDTIFSTLGWLFRLMTLHRDIQARVQKELDEVIGRDGSVAYKERYKIPYTFAVMMESQRFSSIVPLSTTRIASMDFEVRGITIPKGAEICGNLWALHNDPKYWSEPEVFRPERFLTEDGTNLAKTPPSFAPFSLGRRNCPGENVAWMEALAFFSTIMLNFTVEIPPGVQPKFDIVNGLVAHLEPQPLCFKPRQITSC